MWQLLLAQAVASCLAEAGKDNGSIPDLAVG